MRTTLRSDADQDGTVESSGSGSDRTFISDASGEDLGDLNYRVEADLNRDGTIDTSDSGLVTADNGESVAAGVLSEHGCLVGYNGYIHDPATGDYCVRYRWYVPELGRWAKRDPAGYVDGSNAFLYVNSSPIRYSDPGGLQAVAPSVSPQTPTIYAIAWGIEKGIVGTSFGFSMSPGKGYNTTKLSLNIRIDADTGWNKNIPGWGANRAKQVGMRLTATWLPTVFADNTCPPCDEYQWEQSATDQLVSNGAGPKKPDGKDDPDTGEPTPGTKQGYAKYNPGPAVKYSRAAGLDDYPAHSFTYGRAEFTADSQLGCVKGADKGQSYAHIRWHYTNRGQPSKDQIKWWLVAFVW